MPQQFKKSNNKMKTENTNLLEALKAEKKSLTSRMEVIDSTMEKLYGIKTSTMSVTFTPVKSFKKTKKSKITITPAQYIESATKKNTTKSLLSIKDDFPLNGSYRQRVEWVLKDRGRDASTVHGISTALSEREFLKTPYETIKANVYNVISVMMKQGKLIKNTSGPITTYRLK